MKLGYVIIYVKSVPESLTFYQDAFNLQTKFCVPSNEYGELALNDGTVLAFADEQFIASSIAADFRRNRRDEQSHAGAQISLVIDESQGETVDSCIAQALAAGAIMVKEPQVKPWGQTVAYIKDCNGFIVEICTPVNPTASDSGKT